MYPSYVTLSSGVPWNNPRITCINEPLGESVYQENTSDEWNIPRLHYSKALHDHGLHNYFIPYHKKYSGQMGRLGVIQLNCTNQ